MLKRILIAFLLLILCSPLITRVASRLVKPPVGLSDGKLQPCPEKPNCLCSLEDGEHHTEALATTLAEARTALLELPGTTIVEENANYIRAEAHTGIMGYIDDLELHAAGPKLVHIRSASRIGYDDWNANQNRIDQIRANLN